MMEAALKKFENIDCAFKTNFIQITNDYINKDNHSKMI